VHSIPQAVIAHESAAAGARHRHRVFINAQGKVVAQKQQVAAGGR
jgi:hypothetical protein